MDPYVGEIKLFAGNYAPVGWRLCDGSLLNRRADAALFSLIGTTYGSGDGTTTFQLPDLRGRAAIGPGILPLSEPPLVYALGDQENAAGVPTSLTSSQLGVHTHELKEFAPGVVTQPVVTASIGVSPTPGNTSLPFNSVAIARFPQLANTNMYIQGPPNPPISVGGFTAEVSGDVMGTGTLTLDETGNSQPVDLREPYLALNYIIATEGIGPNDLSQQYLGEVRAFAYASIPNGWAQCNGQLLPVNGNNLLAGLIGNSYGGDGTTNFGLPNLQGRVAVNYGADTDFAVLGEAGGSPSVTLSAENLPSHSHASTLKTTPASNVSVSVTLQVSKGAGSQTASNGSLLAGAPYLEANNGILSETPVLLTPLLGVSATLPEFTPSATIGSAGAGAPIDVRPAYLVINYCIATFGFSPTKPTADELAQTDDQEARIYLTHHHS